MKTVKNLAAEAIIKELPKSKRMQLKAFRRKQKGEAMFEIGARFKDNDERLSGRVVEIEEIP